MMKFKNLNIATKIWLPFSVFLILIFGAIVLYYPKKQREVFEEKKYTEMTELVKTVSLGVELSLSNDDFQGLKKTLDFVENRKDFEFVAIVLNESETPEVFLSYPEKTNKDRIINPNLDEILIKDNPFSSKTFKGFIRLGVSKKQINEQIKLLNSPVYIILFIGLITSLLLFFFLAKFISKPIDFVTQVAKQLEKGNYDVYIDNSPGNNEVALLNRAQISLRDKLKKEREINQQLTADLEQKVDIRTADLMNVAKKLSQAQRVSAMGSFSFNFKTKKWEGSESLSEIIDFSAKSGSLLIWSRIISPQIFRDLIKYFNNPENYTNRFSTDCPIQIENEKKWISITCELVLDALTQQPLEIQGTIQDITARKLADAEIRKLSLVAEKTFNSVIITDVNKRIIWANEALTKLSGYTLDEMVGKTPKLFQFEKTDQQTVQFINEKIAKNEPVTAELFNRGKNGNEYWLEVNIVPLYDDENKRYGYMAVETEITQRKESETALKNNILKTERILNSLNECVWGVSLPDYKLEFQSPSTFDLYEYPMEDWLGNINFWIDCIHPDDKEEVLLKSNDLYQYGEVIQEYRIITGTKKIKWISSTTKLLQNETGTPILMTGISADITQRKESETALKNNILKTERILNSLNECVWGVSLPDYKLEFQSPSTFDLYEYPMEDWLGNINFWIDCIHPDDKEEVLLKSNDLYQYGEVIQEYRIITGTKKIKWISSTTKLLQNETGTPILMTGISADITQRKEAEKIIKKSEDNYRKILDNSAELIHTLDARGNVLWANNAWLDNMEVSVEEVRGKNIIEFLSAETLTEFSEVLPKLANGQSVSNLDCRFISLNNREVYLIGKALPVLEDGIYVGSQAYLRNITEAVLAKKEIDRINEGLELTIKERTYQLENAIKELDSFSYSVSHDLRSPLRAIDGWSLALIEDYGEKLDEIALGYIDRMRSESKRMGNLIDDLLSLSKIGKRQISRKQINYKDFCLRIINRIIEAEQYKQPEVIINGNHFIYADENLLDILITNLISNALKFSSKKENPKIEIGVERIDDRPFYYIKDNGAGFEMNNASKLFGAFQRMHKKSEFSGTGIGLATVNRIVNLHGGTIFAESKINEGASFYFNLNDKTNT